MCEQQILFQLKNESLGFHEQKNKKKRTIFFFWGKAKSPLGFKPQFY